MLSIPRFRWLRTTLSGLLLVGALCIATPPVHADTYDTAAPQNPEQAEHDEHRRHLLLLFPAAVAALTLALILYTRRK